MPEKQRPLFVSTPVLADLLRVTPRRLQQLHASGIIPRERRGEWDAVKCVPAYLAFKVEAAVRAALNPPGSGPRKVAGHE